MSYHIVIIGSPCHHFRFFGPFVAYEDATEWGQAFTPPTEIFWVQPLTNRLDTSGAMLSHVIVAGNMIDGLTYYGPFKMESEAMQWARKNILDIEFLHERLTPPRKTP